MLLQGSRSRRPSLTRSALAALTVIVVLAISVGVGEYGKSTVPTFNRDAQALQSPLARILAGDFFSVGENDRVFDQVVETHGRGRAHHPVGID